MRRLWLVVMSAVTVGAAGAAGPASDRVPTRPVDPAAVYVFPGLTGPTNRAVLPEPVPTRWQDFAGGGRSRLAVLLTDPDSAWLGLAHGLRTIGVPFLITTSVPAALEHRVVLVYPHISGKVLDQASLQRLARHPDGGGTLIAGGVLGGGLNETFGFSRVIDTARHRRVVLSARHALAREFPDAAERDLAVAGHDASDPGLVTLSYADPVQPPVAVYEDGTAAIIERRYESGRAVALGVDLGHVLMRGYSRRVEGVGRGYANQYEPTLDVLLRLIQSLYERAEPAAVTVRTVPEARTLAVLLTHDLDYTRSLSNAVHYAEYEAAAGVKATYFLQTKYIRDYNDEVFLTRETVPLVKRLLALGMEVGSHSVSHSYEFAAFPSGTGGESYPEYQPFVKERNLAYNGTVLGELRVSRFLIESLAGVKRVDSFRPGHLVVPFTLPESLEATGYRFSSSMASGAVLTHLPFRLNRGLGYASASRVLEFPISIEDELPPRLDERLPAAIGLARRLARYGGCCVVLIHPDVASFKLAFERGFVSAAREGAWFDTVGGFGAWWEARDEVQVDASVKAGRLVVRVNAPTPLKGLTLQIPPGFRLAEGAGGAPSVQQEGRWVVLSELSGARDLSFELR